MNIKLETLFCWILILVSLYYIFKFLNRFKILDKRITHIDNEIKELNKTIKKNEDTINDDNDNQSKKNISKKILLESYKNIDDDHNHNHDDDDDDNDDNDDDDNDDDNDDDDDDDDDDDVNNKVDIPDDKMDNFTDSGVIEGFNNIDYNDDVQNKLNTSSSTIYGTDFSNIYNNYVKNNLLDIKKVKSNTQTRDSDLYIKSKCRGWKKK